MPSQSQFYGASKGARGASCFIIEKGTPGFSFGKREHKMGIRASVTSELVFEDARVLYAPGKASNAGGVATSGLEMSQNSMRLNWDRDEVDGRLDMRKRPHKLGAPADVDTVAGQGLAEDGLALGAGRIEGIPVVALRDHHAILLHGVDPLGEDMDHGSGRGVTQKLNLAEVGGFSQVHGYTS
mgnify:CR=1 FL=1